MKRRPEKPWREQTKRKADEAAPEKSWREKTRRKADEAAGTRLWRKSGTFVLTRQ